MTTIMDPGDTGTIISDLSVSGLDILSVLRREENKIYFYNLKGADNH